MFEHKVIAPLSGGLMAVSILGFILTAIYADVIGLSWTFTLGLFFLILFISTFISMHYGPVPDSRRRY